MNRRATSSELRVSARNAAFQQWAALLANRTKRQRSGEFLVQGVRPITLAIEHGWRIRALLYDADAGLSRWAQDTLTGLRAGPHAPTVVAMSAELLAELGEKSEAAPELVAVVEMPTDELSRITPSQDMMVLVFDRPTSPGNIGTLLRSADAFGAAGVIVTGHAADIYDPKAVRASTGSLFSVPAVRVPTHREVLDWVDKLRGRVPVRIIGTDERATADAADLDLTGPTLLLIGNETSGLSAAWAAAADDMARIPISGAASSLNAATAASIMLYEAARQRRPVRAP
jgi:23S rRNA (uridine2479-2'-O)-methyltransferase